MGLRGSEVGFKVRVDTTEMRDLSKSATQLTTLISELRELRATAASVISGVGDAVDGINHDTMASVAKVRVEVAELRREIQRASKGEKTPGKSGGTTTTSQNNYDRASFDLSHGMGTLNTSVSHLSDVIVSLEDLIRTKNGVAPKPPPAGEAQSTSTSNAGKTKTRTGTRLGFDAGVGWGATEDRRRDQIEAIPPMPKLNPRSASSRLAGRIPDLWAKHEILAAKEMTDRQVAFDLSQDKVREKQAKQIAQMQKDRAKAGDSKKQIRADVAERQAKFDAENEARRLKSFTNSDAQVYDKTGRGFLRDYFTAAQEEGVTRRAKQSGKKEQGNRWTPYSLGEDEEHVQALSHAMKRQLSPQEVFALTRKGPSVVREMKFATANGAVAAGAANAVPTPQQVVQVVTQPPTVARQAPAGGPRDVLRGIRDRSKSMSIEDLVDGLGGMDNMPASFADKMDKVQSTKQQEKLLRHAWIKKNLPRRGMAEMFEETQAAMDTRRLGDDEGDEEETGGGRKPKKNKSYGEKTASMFSTVSRAAIAGTVIYSGMELAKNSIRGMIEFEDRLNRVRKVLSPTQGDIKALGAAAFQMGQEFGQSAGTIAGTMELFAQQGKKQKDIIDLTRTATMAANVTNLEGAEAVDAITVAMKTYTMEEGTSLRVLNSWVALQNSAGVSAKTFADAFKVAGFTAKNAGIDFDFLNGMISVIGENTKNTGEQIGTTIKMMARNFKEDQGLQTLQGIGISVATDTGKYRDFSHILEDVGKKWGSLSAAQKQNLGMSLAPRNLNSFYALMDNFPKLQDEVSKSMNHGDAATKASAIATESLARKIESLKVAYDGLWQSIGNSGVLTTIKVVTQTLKQMVDLLGTVNNSTGGVLAMAAVIGAPLLAAKKFGAMPNILGAGATGVAESVAESRKIQTVTAAGATAAPGSPMFSTGQVRIGAGAALLGLGSLKQQYDQNWRTKEPSVANTGADIISGLGSTYLTAAMATGKTSPWKGFGTAGIGGKGKFGKTVLLAMLAMGASTIIGSIKDYVTSSGAASAATKPLDSKVAALDADSRGPAILVAKHITETITQYTAAMEHLVHSNSQILDSQKFVASNLLLLGDISGKASAATGGSINAAIAENAGYAKIRGRDVGSMGFNINHADLPGTFREAMSAAVSAQAGGKSVGLQSMVNLSSQLSQLGSLGSNAAGDYVSKIIAAKGATHGRTPSPDEDNVINAAQDQLNRMVGPEQIPHITKLIEDSITASGEHRDKDAENYAQRAKSMANSSITNQSFTAVEALSKGIEDHLGGYVGAQQKGVQSLQDRYDYLRNSGQVKNTQDFFKMSATKSLVGGLNDNADDAKKAADSTREIYENLQKVPKAEQTDAWVRSLLAAERAMNAASSASDTLSTSMTNLVRDTALLQKSREADVAMTIASSRLHSGGALGLTGMNALQFSQDHHESERDALLAQFKGDDVMKEKLTAAMEQLAQQTKLQVAEMQTSRKSAIAGAPQAYGTYRFLSQMGVMNPGAGATQAGQAALDQYHELLQDIYKKNSGRLNGASESERRDFGNQVKEALGEYGGRMRDLEISSDPEYQKNYLLASNSERAGGDYARGLVRSGTSAEDIFSDPYSRMAAKDNPLMGRVLEQAVAGDYQRQTVDLLKDLVRLQEQATNSLTGRGLMPSHAAGTLNQAGVQGVDSSGRISSDNQLARLHKGEIVLNKRQADQLMRNHYDTGTAPGLKLSSLFDQTAFGKGVGRGPSLAGLSSTGKEAVLAAIKDSAIKGDLLGLGKTDMQYLIDTLKTSIGPVVGGEGANTAGAMFYNATAAHGRLSKSQIILDRLFSSTYSHELTHGLNEMWKGSGTKGLNSHLGSLIMDNSDPGMSLARGRVFNNYPSLRKSIENAGPRFWGTKNGQHVIDEVLASRTQLARTIPLPKALVDLHKNSLLGRMELASTPSSISGGLLSGIKSRTGNQALDILKGHGYGAFEGDVASSFLKQAESTSIGTGRSATMKMSNAQYLRGLKDLGSMGMGKLGRGLGAGLGRVDKFMSSPLSIPVMLAADYLDSKYGVSQHIADKVGVGDWYKNGGQTLVGDSTMVGLTALHNWRAASAASRMSAAELAAGKSIGIMGRGLGAFNKVAEPIMAAKLGYDLSIVPYQAMNKTGLISDSTMHWIGQGHAMIGEGTSEALGVAGNAIFGGKDGRAQSAAIVGRYAKNATAFNPETDPWRHVRLNNPGSWVAGAYLAAGDGFSRIFGMGTAHDQLSQEAQEQRDNYLRGISGALFHAPGKDFKGTLSQLAAAHGLTVDQKTLDQMAAVAERMPGANVKQILEAISGGHGTLGSNGNFGKNFETTESSTAFNKALAATFNGERAGKLSVNLDKQVADRKEAMRKEAVEMEKHARTAAFEGVRNSLGPRVSQFNDGVVTLDAQVKALMKELVVPEYTKGASTDRIADMLGKYNEKSPALRAAYVALAGQAGGIGVDSDKLLGLFKNLPEDVNHRMTVGTGLPAGQAPTAADLAGFKSIASLDGLNKYFGPAGALDTWAANANSTAANFQAANTAWELADPSVKKLNDRDHKIEMIRRKIKVTKDGHSYITTGVRLADPSDQFFTRGSGVADPRLINPAHPDDYMGMAMGNIATKDKYYGGGAIQTLTDAVAASNESVVKREATGDKVIEKLTTAQMSGKMARGSEAFLAGLEEQVPGMSKDLAEYARIQAGIAALKGSTDGSSEVQRAALMKDKADLILKRDFTEKLFKDAQDRVSAMSDKAVKSSAKTNAPTKKVSGPTTYSIDGQPVNFENSEGSMTFRRHMGGVFTGEAIIRTGKNSSEMVISPDKTDQFYAGLNAIKKLSSRDDAMTSDARQFANTVVPGEVTGGVGTMQHSGAVSVGMDTNMQGLLGQVIQVMQKTASKGRSMKMGDKLYQPLVGR